MVEEQGERRKLAAILVSDVVGYSRLAGADEERRLARPRGLRSELIDPAIAAHRGRSSYFLASERFAQSWTALR
jgi:class 3 adenylate cyclase